MKSVSKERRESRLKRHDRIRRRVSGTEAQPRLCVFRSHAHVHVQIVDDARGVSLVGASTLSPELKGALAGKKKTEASHEVGKLVAARALAKGIKRVRFDRGGYIYHGRVKAVAEGARAGGLEF
ncbi:MAG: 50S ribosomal protein L18 [Candidatus Eisenbacteria bacterium]|uniref:Large ribosomal subunit protein uL18 n=1 Tax=Eiseniibacteriota bacterium TaxID=2212470 RepID=A0A937XBX2_UNCEI|nr:50S ribosomal protein L18 [Candidatus Eisenbacteria bacterium]